LTVADDNGCYFGTGTIGAERIYTLIDLLNNKAIGILSLAEEFYKNTF